MAGEKEELKSNSLCLHTKYNFHDLLFSLHICAILFRAVLEESFTIDLYYILLIVFTCKGAFLLLCTFCNILTIKTHNFNIV